MSTVLLLVQVVEGGRRWKEIQVEQNASSGLYFMVAYSYKSKCDKLHSKNVIEDKTIF